MAAYDSIEWDCKQHSRRRHKKMANKFADICIHKVQFIYRAIYRHRVEDVS